MTLRRTGAVLAVGLALSLAGCTGLLLQQETAFVAGEANVSAENASEAYVSAESEASGTATNTSETYVTAESEANSTATNVGEANGSAANATEANSSKTNQLSYTHNRTAWQNVTRSVKAAGQEREVTVSNRAEVFVNRSANGTPAATFTVVSSPQVEVAGQELSPVAGWSQRDLLTQFAGQFDQYGTITNVEERETRQVRMLGTDANMRVFNATLKQDANTTDNVVVSVVKVKHEGDYVVAIGVRGIDDAELSATEGDTEALVRRVEH